MDSFAAIMRTYVFGEGGHMLARILFERLAIAIWLAGLVTAGGYLFG
jgi:hypothetical protein